MLSSDRPGETKDLYGWKTPVEAAGVTMCVYVVLDDPVRMNTSQATAPVWRDVMARALQAGGVVPSGTRSPDLPTTW